jgi:CRISPR-associated protein Cas6
MNDDPVVDLAFVVRGTSIPADHGYLLYAAIARQAPSLHGDERIGIHPIRGQLSGGRQLAITRESRLVLRLPASRIPGAICLAGKALDIAGGRLSVGVPTVLPLRPATRLTSRLVVIRGFTESGPFLDAVQRQLAALDVAGTTTLVAHRWARPLEGQRGSGDSVVRRTLRIHDKEVVGFAVRVDGLTELDSLRLQTAGLGGRRRFGCGIFVPTGVQAA